MKVRTAMRQAKDRKDLASLAILEQAIETATVGGIAQPEMLAEAQEALEEARLDAAADAEAAAARHFSVAHPSNVVIGGKGRKGELRRWMRKNAKTPKAAAGPHIMDDGDDEYYDEAEEDALEEELGRQAEAERAARAPGQSA